MKSPAISVLLNELDPESGVTLALALRIAGFDVTVAHDAREALRLIGAQAFDAIVTDFMMSEADGFELLAQLRTLTHRPAIITLDAPGLPARADVLEIALKLGACAPLRKPFTTRQLVDAIHRACSERRAACTPELRAS